MNKEVIASYVTIPMAIKVLQQDCEVFNDFKMYRIYLSKIDAVMDQLQHDFNATKKHLYTVDYVKISCIEKGDTMKYNVCGNGMNKVFEFTPSELRSLTSELMRDYLYGDKAIFSELKEDTWMN
ncbi:hypothetical protein [Virgibacillus litoralis]|uniref:Uncharacterized protein n=1 Tax=Virgibacillus litoralis TaxID=578221 RepID=A0ABS4HC35_9BACI|nr:hypothetical protein [Virgibacillus litoralis]MBP1948475.1 hypothetical protein [Virgibacillus litoralis]